VLHAGGAAYSCLALLPDGRIGCLYERGRDGAGADDAYDRITFARFSLDWLTNDRAGTTHDESHPQK
jgi:sialidase-1